MFGWILAGLELPLVVLLAVVVFRFSKRLLQFDELMDAIVGPMTSYAEDLGELSSREMLLDNPEVKAFHKRNLQMLSEIESATWAINGRKARPNGTNPPSVE